MENSEDLSMLNDRYFALHLLDLQSEKASIWKTAEALFKGNDPDPIQLQKAVSDLQGMQKTALANELRSRYSMEDKEMTEAEMTAWVRQNCKFASKKTAGIMDFTGPMQPGSNPHQVFQTLLQAYKSRAAKMGPSTPQEIQMDLAQVDQQMFAGQATLNTPENVQALMRAATPAQPAQPAAKPSRYIPDPVDQYMDQPNLPKPMANGL